MSEHKIRLVVLGDSVAVGAGAPPGLGFMDLLMPELTCRHVQVENWSNASATAIGCHRQIAEIRRRLEQSSRDVDHLYVLVELGRNDRMLRVGHHDLFNALNEIIDLVIFFGAHPIIMELIPDGIEHHLHKEWHEEKKQHVGMIKTPDAFRHCMLMPKEGHMPTMVDYSYLAPDMVNYNARGHSVIAAHTLNKLIHIMHLPKDRPTPGHKSPTHGSPTHGSPAHGSPTHGSPTHGNNDTSRYGEDVEAGEEVCSVM